MNCQIYLPFYDLSFIVKENRFNVHIVLEERILRLRAEGSECVGFILRKEGLVSVVSLRFLH